MGETENLNFGELDDSTKNLLGTNGKEIVGELNEKRIVIPLVGDEEVVGRGEYERDGTKGKRGFKKYKQKNFDEYYAEIITGTKEVPDSKYKQTIGKGDEINSKIRILGSDIPNNPEFHRLFTELEDKYGREEIQFLCREKGHDRFYHVFRNTNLFDITKVIEKINNTIYSEQFRNFIQLDLTGTIPDRHKGGKGENDFYLHMSRGQKAETLKVLRYFNGKESAYGLACCIFFFNFAKEKYEHLRTDKFKVYYSNDGYAKIIQEEMQEAAQVAIARLVEGLPILLNELDEKYTLASNSELSKCEERKVDFKYQLEAMDDAFNVINKSDMRVPTLHSLEYIVIKEKAEGVYIPPG